MKKKIPSTFTKGTTHASFRTQDIIVSAETLEAILKPLEQYEKDHGRHFCANFDNRTYDSDLLNWFKGMKIPGVKKVGSKTTYFLNETVTHQTIIDTAKSANIYFEADWQVALKLGVLAVLAGNVETENRGVTIYTSTKRKSGNVFCSFGFYRFGGSLHVTVNYVDFDDKRYSGDGVVLS